MQTDLLHALGISDCAVFKLAQDNAFILEVSQGDWLKHVFSHTFDTASNIKGHSAFLDDFLIDAQEHWQSQQTHTLDSGMWSEEFNGHTLHLSATASVHDGASYLVIQNVKTEHQQRQKTLQVARELLISNDQTAEQHIYMIERMRSALMQNASAGNNVNYLSEALKHADIGVIITDSSNLLIEANPAAHDAFELSSQQQSPLDILQELLDKQFPVGLRSPSKDKTWTGELYWYSPPQLHKWIRLNIHAVCSDSSGNNITHYIYTFNDITRVKYLLQSNQELRLTDMLTGLPNRQHFWQALSQYTQSQTPFYVIYLDIVNFRQVNEMFGHQIGDTLLVRFKERIQKQINSQDLVCRIGADEFAVVHFAQDENQAFKQIFDDAFKLSEDMLDATKLPFILRGGKSCELRVKAGVAQYPDDANDAEALISCVDLALGSAKQNPNKDIEFYSSELRSTSRRRLQLVEALNDAIQNDQLELLLQPIIDINTGRVVKAEALLRWHISPTETISPDVFIPLAEENGLIVGIGRWVIYRVCEMLATLQQQKIELPITLNLSPKQLADVELTQYIQRSMSHHNLSGNLMELEVTEGVLVNNQSKARQFLENVRNLGISVSIDDFGTGYSSLSYLKYLPIDHLKIDRSFIADLDSSTDDQAIVLAVIAMAQRLKLGVIAEGVENDFQRQFLADAHCDIAQGFLFSKPLQLEPFIHYLNEINNASGRSSH